jgi:transcriptional regulator with XRE-family HTH domain
MTDSTDRMLSAFIDAWIAGERPRLEDYVHRVAPAERAALADAIDDFVTLAPAPRYDQDTLRAIRAEAAGATAPAAALPALLTRLRAGAGLSARDLADRLSATLDICGRQAKVERYVEQLERGELDGRRLSQRLLDALARLLSIDTDTLDHASRLAALQPAGIRLRGGEAETAGQVRDKLETLAELMATPPAEQWDEADELFLGGR